MTSRTPTEGASVPGQFRRLSDALGCEQLALTLIGVPPHSDFEQGRATTTRSRRELYIVARRTLTMCEDDEPVEMWAVSRRLDRHDAVKLDDFLDVARRGAGAADLRA
jgi:hypothetical protein